jgi:hypothetical protein
MIIVMMVTIFGLIGVVVGMIASDDRDNRIACICAAVYGISIIMLITPLLEMRKECISEEPKSEICAKVLESTGL